MQQYELCWSGPPAMNPAAHLRHPISRRRAPPHEKRILGLLKADQTTHMDEIVEQLETEMSPSEIFAASLFELELAGKVRQMSGKNFVRSF